MQKQLQHFLNKLKIFLVLFNKLVILGTLHMPGYVYPKWYYELVENFCVCLQAKKSTSNPMFFGRDCKDTQIFYFWYFGHVWLCSLKMIVPTCRKLQCLNCISHFFEILHLKDFAIWLADRILAKNLRTIIFPNMKFVGIYQYFEETLMTKFFKKSKKSYSGPLLPKFGQN